MYNSEISDLKLSFDCVNYSSMSSIKTDLANPIIQVTKYSSHFHVNMMVWLISSETPYIEREVSSSSA